MSDRKAPTRRVGRRWGESGRGTAPHAAVDAARARALWELRGAADANEVRLWGAVLAAVLQKWGAQRARIEGGTWAAKGGAPRSSEQWMVKRRTRPSRVPMDAEAAGGALCCGCGSW